MSQQRQERMSKRKEGNKMDFIWVFVAAVVMIGLCAATGEPETLTEQAERLARKAEREGRRQA